MCKSVVDTAGEHDTSLLPKAQELSQTFLRAFTLFSKCHKIYESSSLLTVDEIQSLRKFNWLLSQLFYYITGQHINDFVSFYRVTFPEATFLPKMHMLEEHVVPWLEQWQVGSDYPFVWQIVVEVQGNN